MPAAAFDPAAATAAWLATVPPDVAARSDAYFEGGYWLLLWGTLISVGAAWVLLHFGVAARLRWFAERASKSASVVSLLFAAGCASTSTGSPPRASARGSRSEVSSWA